MPGYRELFQELLERMRFLIQQEEPELAMRDEVFLQIVAARLDFSVLENLLSLIDEFTGFEFERRRHRRGQKTEEPELRLPRYCVTCGKPLTGMKRKYCSRVCQYGGILHIARPMCIRCGQLLVRKAKWCPACRRERIREYNREYARARRARIAAERIKRAA